MQVRSLMRMDPTQITPYLGMIYLVVLSIYRLLLLLCEIDVTFRLDTTVK